MATDSDRILVAGMARLYLAPVGSLFPTKSNDPLDAAWVEAGFFTDDSLGFETEPKFYDVMSHQANYPTRKVQTEDAATLSVDLQEWSEVNLRAAFGGGSVVAIVGTPTQYKFSPPAIGGREEVAAIAELVDGGKQYRLCLPKAMQTGNVKVDLQKKKESLLPLALAVLGSDAGDPWYLLTNDTALTPAA